MDDQSRLKACRRSRKAAERGNRLAKLIPFGPVLGVEDHDIFATRKWKRIVDGFGFCARQTDRHANDFEWPRAMQRHCRTGGFEIIVFYNQNDLEQVLRVIQFRQRPDKAGQHIGFAIEWDEQCVAGQILFGFGSLSPDTFGG
jgi:hypothetical protein